jgi:SRSO17 transposase
MSGRYDGFSDSYDGCFRSGNHDVSRQARQYLSGLIQAPKRNMERMAEVVPDSDSQVLQNFLTHSGWNHRAVMDQVARDANDWVGGNEGSGLYIDETCFAKKGNHSVGVARQWNGRLGKTDNCQVGVFGALGKGKNVSLIDARLYLPEVWTNVPKRCAKAGVPHKQRVHKTKPDLAAEIVEQARSNGVRFEWVGMDAAYGSSFKLLQGLDANGEIFVADVRKNRHIYLEDPAPYLPDSVPGRGRKRRRLRSDHDSVEVGDWVAAQSDDAWKRTTLRDGERGSLAVELLRARVWIWDKKSETAQQWHLLCRREIGKPNTIKYSVSNASAEISLSRLGRMQAQRFWIERAFQDAKSHMGMHHYQARKWLSWHRHMALVMMAQQFMLQERMINAETYPLLSCYDIQIMLCQTLPARKMDRRTVKAMMIERHRRRQAAMESAKRRPKPETYPPPSVGLSG